MCIIYYCLTCKLVVVVYLYSSRTNVSDYTCFVTNLNRIAYGYFLSFSSLRNGIIRTLPESRTPKPFADSTSISAAHFRFCKCLQLRKTFKLVLLDIKRGLYVYSGLCMECFFASSSTWLQIHLRLLPVKSTSNSLDSKVN